MLLPFAEIQARLAERYGEDLARYPASFAPLVPKPPKAGSVETVVAVTASQLGARLPASFVDALQVWDLGQLRIRNTVFCLRGNYEECLIAYNAGRAISRWWEDRDVDLRPIDLLMIAQGDPHVALLNIETGGIEAYSTDRGSVSSQRVAKDLSDYLRGLGTVDLERERYVDRHGFLRDLLSDLGPKVDGSYWGELIGVDE